MNKKDNLQSAYLKAAVSRVKVKFLISFFWIYLQICNKTGFDEEEGIFSLRPLFYPEDYYDMKFGLSSSNFSVRYSTYYNDRCQYGLDCYWEAKRKKENPKRKVFWFKITIWFEVEI